MTEGADKETRESPISKLERNLELVTDARDVSYAEGGNSVTLSRFRNQIRLKPQTLEMDEVAEVFEVIFSGSEEPNGYNFKIGDKKNIALRESINAKLVYTAAKYISGK